jgi:CelD/BcsL family acetyltransferase involved in cellulose biosynthesis
MTALPRSENQPQNLQFPDTVFVSGLCRADAGAAMLDSFDGAPVKVTVLEKIPEDPEIIVAWNDLVFRMERPEVFFTHQWALAASRAFSDSLRPLTFLVYESGRLGGVAAMATNQDSPDTAFFLTASTADYCDIVSAPEAREAVLAATFQEMKKRSVRDLVLANVPLESHTLRAIRAVARSHRFHLEERPGYDCGVISLDDEEKRQTVLQSVGRKEREKRGLKKLGQLGPVGIAHLSAERLDTGLESIFAAQISRFLATNRLSPLIRPQRRFFLSELARLLNSAGWLKVSQLEVNGRPIAWNYGFRFFDSWFWYLPTFQIQYEESSPGSCLLRLLTEEACADLSVKRLDLGLGEEAYKERFSNDICSTRYVQLSNSMTRHLVNVGRHWLAASVGRFPGMDKQLRRGRESFRSLQSRIGETGVVATATHALTSAKRCFISEDELVFFEAPRMESENASATLRPLGWEEIASAALNNADDEPTLEYFVRCAQRLRQGRATGYFLPGRGTQPSHFLWVDLYDGFYLSEFNSRLESNDPNAAMIFDCWTPAAQRGRGNYATAIRLAAAYLQRQQRQVWIFSAAKNESSVRGILRAGFVYRFSLVRSRRLWHTALSRRVDHLSSEAS